MPLEKILKKFEEISTWVKASLLIKLPNSKWIKVGKQTGLPIIINIKTYKGLEAILSRRELAISEAYMYGDIELDKQVDMLKLIKVKTIFINTAPVIRWLIHTFSLLFNNQVSINEENISKHYEFDHDFYLMFLDKTRSYSHGIFTQDNEPQENASYRKLKFAMDCCHVRSGNKVLDVGAGWGDAVEYLGKKGICVDAITIANQSVRFVSDLIREKKLPNCHVVKKDFLEYEVSEDKQYDAIFSLGTLEHLPNYKLVLKKCAALLKQGGYTYFDASASSPNKSINSDFIERHIFPGNHVLLDIFRFLNAVKQSSFKLISLHNDTHNYYLTLKAWAERLDSHKDEIITRWGEVHYRKFQLYLWGCCYGMQSNELNAYRIVLQKYQ
jgi:cyclopropane-fatty-acyl-phospholipid synthase